MEGERRGEERGDFLLFGIIPFALQQEESILINTDVFIFKVVQTFNT